MRKILIITFGSAKNSHFFSSYNEYLKRLKNKIEVIELKQADGATAKEIINKEMMLLKKYYNENNINVFLSEEGKEYDSQGFSRFFCNLIECEKNICFFIGGSYGFDKNFFSKKDYIVSLSKMTMPHLLARIILLEQIYRSFCIFQNHPYHK